MEEAVADVLLDPDEVRHRPWRYSQLLFVRIGEDGDRVVVVTVDDEPIDDQRPPRTWVVTAFATPDEPLSALLWVKS